MRQTSRSINHGAVRRRLWSPRPCLLLVLFFFSATNSHLVWSQTEQPIISVDAQDQPLSEVLADIERQTGYRITINDQWKGHRVAVAFRDKPLGKALQYILTDFNHAIFYGPDNQIKIVIYTPKDHDGSDAGTPRISEPEPPPQEPVSGDEEPMAVEQDETPAEESTDRDETAGEQEPVEPAAQNEGRGEENSEQIEPDKVTDDQAPEAPLPQDQEQTD